ncbi:MAG TPA: hypothetical protein GX713_05310 [Mollicutes bacterium]|nr:hypothetical protein [Mollicutes bacterium]
MNNKYKILISIIIVFIIGGLIFYLYKNNEEVLYPVTDDSLEFQKEYQALNGEVNVNNGKKYLEIDMISNAPIKYSNYDEIFEILESKSGVIYFGFPECPWCRNIALPLVDSAMEYGLEKIYYLNNRLDRDTLSLDKKGKIVTEKEGTKEYLKLINLLKDFLPEYGGINNSDIKRLYFPTVVFVKDGTVLGIESVLESYSKRVEGDGYIPMLDEEIKELKDIYKSYYKKIEN